MFKLNAENIEEIEKLIKDGFTSGHLKNEEGKNIYFELSVNVWNEYDKRDKVQIKMGNIKKEMVAEWNEVDVSERAEVRNIMLSDFEAGEVVRLIEEDNDHIARASLKEVDDYIDIMVGVRFPG